MKYSEINSETKEGKLLVGAIEMIKSKSFIKANEDEIMSEILQYVKQRANIKHPDLSR